MPLIKTTFWNSYFKIFIEPHYEGNDDQFAKYCLKASESSFPGSVMLLIIMATFWSSYYKICAEPILAQNMANLQNTVTRLLFTVFRWSTFAYHLRKILESLL